MVINPLRKYIREGSLPHFFCPGCGAAQVLNFFIRAIDELQLDLKNIIGIGGVGCTARIPVYLNVDALHGIHGRTLPWATGIKLVNPGLKVVIFAGDGDAAAIGGNHLIQAARRNLDVTMIVVNNLTYGMTGGQVAPTTHQHLRTITTPYGNPEPSFDLAKLVTGAGATFVSRWSTDKPRQTIDAIKKALNHKGFSFVEVISQCPTGFGRKAINSGDGVQGIKWIKEHSILIKSAEELSANELKDRFVLGNFVQIEAPIFLGSSYIQPEEE
jgi:2-oxoglutarate/2-oxoacid ferredoxin oxidoreductase subunit beta